MVGPDVEHDRERGYREEIIIGVLRRVQEAVGVSNGVGPIQTEVVGFDLSAMNVAARSRRSNASGKDTHRSRRRRARRRGMKKKDGRNGR